MPSNKRSGALSAESQRNAMRAAVIALLDRGELQKERYEIFRKRNPDLNLPSWDERLVHPRDPRSQKRGADGQSQPEPSK